MLSDHIPVSVAAPALACDQVPGKHRAADSRQAADCVAEMLVSGDINILGEQELARVTREEFGEEEEVMDTALGEMEQWIESCPHLAHTRRDREWLR